MLNALANTKFDVNDIYSMIDGHKRFLIANTGNTPDGLGDKDHYAINDEGIIANNRHFIAYTQQEAMPNGDATTEGQSLLIIGFCYAYMATGIEEYWNLAKKYFDAYIQHFYAGRPVPMTEGAYICNWLVNGKQPTLANYPLSNDNTITHAGFLGDDESPFMNFQPGPNGQLQAKIPQGDPHYGEYLDRATFAYEGSLGWRSLVATVYASQADGSTDWTFGSSDRGKEYPVDWAITWDGKKMSYDDGQVDENPNRDNKNGTGYYLYNPDGSVKLDKWGSKVTNPNYSPIYKQYSGADIGTVCLKKQWYNKVNKRYEDVPSGIHKFNYATKNPVNEKGFELKRNVPWHNRPCVVPMKVIPADMGNASDAEQWFGDAAYLMYRLAPDLDPDKSKYQSVWKCVIFNCRTYTDIDSADKFFRKDEHHVMGRPWTDGISYYYTYPGKQIIGETNFDRDGLGYIEAKPPLKTKTLTLEQQAVWYKVGPQSEVVSYVGGLSDQTPDGFLPIRVNVEVVLAENKTDPDSRMTRWRASIPTNSGGTADEYRIPLSQFVASYRPGTNVPYNMCTTSTVATFGPNALTTPSAKTVFLDSSEFWDGRRDSVVEIEWGDTLEDSSGVSLGLTWSTGGGKIPFGSLYYRSDVPFTITYVDSQKWHWHWDVPATAIDATTHKPVWGQFPINKSNAIFSLWQPDHPLPAYYRWMIWSHYQDWWRPSSIPGVGQKVYKDMTTNDPGPNPYWDPDPKYRMIAAPLYPSEIEDSDITLSHTTQNNVTKPDLTAGGHTQVYCINEAPPIYYLGNRYLMLYSLTGGWDDTTYADNYQFTMNVGDCYVDKYLAGNLDYTPGCIPFSNIYSEGAIDTFDGWHGMPYPGYQHPFVFVPDPNESYDRQKDAWMRLNNMIDFMYDSQLWYFQHYGILGPGASAYVWNRWDNYKYGTPDNFTMYHWGDGDAWSGYQARAYFSAARALYELQINLSKYDQSLGFGIPDKLKWYVENWSKYLFNFMNDSINDTVHNVDDNGKPRRLPVSPTDWGMSRTGGVAVPNPSDYTPHMNGLFLAGACMAAIAGLNLKELPPLIEMLAEELNSNYKVSTIPKHVMNGCWTYSWLNNPADGIGADSNAAFFGFHAGECLRGLALYILYKNLNTGSDMYEYSRNKGVF